MDSPNSTIPKAKLGDDSETSTAYSDSETPSGNLPLPIADAEKSAVSEESEWTLMSGLQVLGAFLTLFNS
jgi:hypothetical protein